MAAQRTWPLTTSSPESGDPRHLLVLVQLLDQVAQLGAQEVAGRHLAEGHPQRGDLAGQELHVGVRAGVGLAVLLVDHPVAHLLPVLREQDQRCGVRRLEAEHQGQEDERVVVPAQVARRQDVPEHPEHHEQRHVDQEPGGAHEAGELLGEDAEGVLLHRGSAHEGAAYLARGVQAGEPGPLLGLLLPVALASLGALLHDPSRGPLLLGLRLLILAFTSLRSCGRATPRAAGGRAGRRP